MNVGLSSKSPTTKREDNASTQISKSEKNKDVDPDEKISLANLSMIGFKRDSLLFKVPFSWQTESFRRTAPCLIIAAKSASSSL